MSESDLSDPGFSEFTGNLYAKPYEFVMSVFSWGEETLPDGGFNP